MRGRNGSYVVSMCEKYLWEDILYGLLRGRRFREQSCDNRSYVAGTIVISSSIDLRYVPTGPARSLNTTGLACLSHHISIAFST
jgi:hypothetical protein